jgi:hypothetical protein
VRAPVKGESSSANVHVPSDADTIFGAPSVSPNPSDSPTVVGTFSQVLSGDYTEGGQLRWVTWVARISSCLNRSRMARLRAKSGRMVPVVFTEALRIVQFGSAPVN